MSSCDVDCVSCGDMQEADADRSDRRNKGDRSDRAQASLREREREVQMSRTRQEKEWDKEKDSLRKAEALQLFNAMLVDMVRLVGSSGCMHVCMREGATSGWLMPPVVVVGMCRGTMVKTTLRPFRLCMKYHQYV